jgi:hypothetical protein
MEVRFPVGGQKLLSSPQLLDRFWNPLRHILNRHRGLFLPEVQRPNHLQLMDWKCVELYLHFTVSHRGVLFNLCTRVRLVSLCSRKLPKDGTPVPKHVSETFFFWNPHGHLSTQPVWPELLTLNFLLALRHYYRTNYSGIRWPRHISQPQHCILRARTIKCTESPSTLLCCHPCNSVFKLLLPPAVLKWND